MDARGDFNTGFAQRQVVLLANITRKLQNEPNGPEGLAPNKLFAHADVDKEDIFSKDLYSCVLGNISSKYFVTLVIVFDENYLWQKPRFGFPLSF